MFARPSALVLITALACTGSDPDDTLESGGTGDTADAGPRAQVEGRVTDGDGSQPARLGGSGSVSAATAVAAATVDARGELTVVGEADVDADGSFTLDVPAGRRGMIVTAVDTDGDVVASAILEDSGEAGTTTVCTPLDTESSVEAEVYLEMRAQAAATANFVDLRARIDEATAVAVRSDVDSDARIVALAEAVRAAQATEIESYTGAGLVVTQADLLDSEIEASQALSISLDAGTPDYDGFFADLDDAAQTAGATAEEHSDAQASASAAFRFTLGGRLGRNDVVDVAAVSAASFEARAHAPAIAIILTDAGVAASVENAVTAASNRLQADLSAAGGADDAVVAYADWQAALIGQTSVEGTVLGDVLEVDTFSALKAQGAVSAMSTAETTLEKVAIATVDTALEGPTVDAAAVATGLVQAYTAFRTTAETQASTTLTGLANTDEGGRLLVVAMGALAAES